MKRITIIDHGLSNLLSVQRAFEHFGAEVEITSGPAAIEQAETLVLPGVGAFRDGMANLRKYGLIDPQINKWRTGRPPEVLPMDVDFGRNRLTSISDDNPRYIAYKLEKAEKKEKKEKKWER